MDDIRGKKNVLDSLAGESLNLDAKLKELSEKLANFESLYGESLKTLKASSTVFFTTSKKILAVTSTT